MDKINSVEDLEVFRLAHCLSLKIHKTTLTFPSEERFGLVAQMRRASTSIGMNLAEGAGRLNTKEYKHFVEIARGSANEIYYQLKLAHDLNLIDTQTFNKLRCDYESVKRMLTRLAESLSRK